MSTQTASQTDIRLYRVVHEMFRRSMTRLIDATAKLEPSGLQPVIRPQWDFYTAILDHHHHTEDVSIFPALLTVRPEMRTTIDLLEDEHVELAPNIDAVESAVAAFVKLSDQSTQHAVQAHPLVALRDRLSPHLDLEDEKILPAVAESIPPKQWDQLDKAALKSIPRKRSRLCGWCPRRGHPEPARAGSAGAATAADPDHVVVVLAEAVDEPGQAIPRVRAGAILKQ